MRKVLSVALILLGFAGIALCGVGIFYVWRTAPTVESGAHETFGTALEALHTVDRSFVLASTTLTDTVAALDELEATTLGVCATVSETRPALLAMAVLFEEDLPASIDSSATALDAVGEAAGVMDRTLSGLDMLHLVNYDPAVPMDDAVDGVSQSLEPVPDDMRAVGASLRQTADSLGTVEEGVSAMAGSIGTIRTDVAQAGGLLVSYQQTAQDLQGLLRRVDGGVGEAVDTARLGLTLLLAWIGLSQLGLVQWGVSLWRLGGEIGARKAPQPAVPAQPESA